MIALLGAAALAAQAEPVGATTPSQAVEEFIRAAADSNLVRMGELFGTDKGSFATTGDPKNWGQRAAIIQAALAGISVKALAETALERKDHSKVTTELARGACRVTLAVTTVKAKEGWLVVMSTRMAPGCVPATTPCSPKKTSRTSCGKPTMANNTSDTFATA